MPHRRALSWLSMAALLLVMVAGAYLVHHHGGSPASTLSSDASASMTNMAPTPSGGTSILLRRITLDPGASYQQVRFGAAFFMVETGELSFRSQPRQAARLFRSNDIATIESTGIVVLENESEASVTVLEVGILPLGTVGQEVFDSEGVHVTDDPSAPIGIKLVGNDAITLEKFTLKPGARVETFVAGDLEILVIQAGSMGLTLDGADVPQPFETGVELERRAGMSVTIAAGTGIVMRNSGDEPLVFLMLTVESPLGFRPG